MFEKLKGKNPKILLIGDIMVDHYIEGECSRLSPEAPIQILDYQKERRVLGGAGNVLNNLISLGAKTTLISVIGRDSEGDWLHRTLFKLGGEHKLIRSNRETTVKSRVVANNYQLLRIDKESNQSIEREIEETIISFVENNILNFDSIIFSDYGKGVVTHNLCQKIITLANKNKIKTFIDPKGVNYEKYRGAYLLKPNKKEALEIVGESKKNIDINKIGFAIQDKFNIENLVITLSEDGMKLFKNGEVYHLKTFAKEVFDVTGAGDTALASLSFGISCGLNIEEALHLANKSSAIVIGKHGTATITLNELFKQNQLFYNQNELLAIIEKDKQKWKKIVFTNGCFDILHVGHTRYLEQARKLGDLLIVAVNSDNSVRRLKGANRPINGELERAELLSNLRFVDYVIIFDEDTPYNLIKDLKPNILVKGGDYKDKNIVGSELVDEVKIVELVEGYSTTNIINKINS
jgi:D-beta-D-heptose 7-phosphate kinase/D-beta-D-heptose 1-phosphate adenosyltransferase